MCFNKAIAIEAEKRMRSATTVRTFNSLGHKIWAAAVMTHLLYNHYPPVPSSMVGPCVRAIEYANKGEWDKKVRMPEGITYKGKKLAPIDAVIESHHLEFFLDEEEDW